MEERVGFVFEASEAAEEWQAAFVVRGAGGWRKGEPTQQCEGGDPADGDAHDHETNKPPRAWGSQRGGGGIRTFT